jgi:hypothetical protein
VHRTGVADVSPVLFHFVRSGIRFEILCIIIIIIIIIILLLLLLLLGARGSVVG